MRNIMDLLFIIVVFIFLSYPVISAINNLAGFIIAKFVHNQKYEYNKKWDDKITILVPIKNEEKNLNFILNYLCSGLTYKNYEVIALNDNSTDKSLRIIKSLMKKYSHLKLIDFKINMGKAKVLNYGIEICDSEFVMICDGDTYMQKNALEQYLKYFRNDQRIGAVSGNISIPNTEKLIEKSQVVEFSSLLGLVKRTQQHIFNKLFTVSGANAMFRRKALYDVNLFNTTMYTEDIAITWDLQLSSWKVHFAPNILFYSVVPDKSTKLFRQRRRWAKGGMQVWIKNTKKVWQNPLKNLGLIYIWLDYLFTLIWTVAFIMLLLAFFVEFEYFYWIRNYFEIYEMFSYLFIFIHFQILIGLFEIILSLWTENKIENKWKYLLYVPLYVLFYWVVSPISLLTSIYPVIKSFIRKRDITWKTN